MSVAELVAVQFNPLAPVLLRTLYLGKQALTAFAGMADGKGFNLKLSSPGLELLDGTELLYGRVLPPGFQLVVLVRAGERLERRDGGVSVNAEIQIFEPWFEQVDIGEVRESRADSSLSRAFGTPTFVETAEPASSDPWAEWLALLGRRLIDDLPAAVSQAPSLAFVQEIKSREVA